MSTIYRYVEKLNCWGNLEGQVASMKGNRLMTLWDRTLLELLPDPLSSCNGFVFVQDSSVYSPLYPHAKKPHHIFHSDVKKWELPKKFISHFVCIYPTLHIFRKINFIPYLRFLGSDFVNSVKTNFHSLNDAICNRCSKETNIFKGGVGTGDPMRLWECGNKGAVNFRGHGNFAYVKYQMIEIYGLWEFYMVI